MIAVCADGDGPLRQGGLALASRPHPPAELFTVEPGPDPEKRGAGGAGSLSLLIEQGRRILDQGEIIGMLGHGGLELVRGDQSVLMFTEAIPGRESSSG